MVKRISFILFLFTYGFCNSQNLVPNGDFEKYYGCPTDVAQIDSCVFWFNPTTGPDYSTPDYFNQCAANSGVGVPVNYFGFQKARSGNAYCGIDLYSLNSYGSNYREYIEVQLTKALLPNVCYHFSMYVNLANNVRFKSHDIGAYFSDTIISGITNYLPLQYKPQVENTPGIYPDTIHWTLVEGNFKAKGGEQFIVIGNFKYDAKTNLIVANKNESYEIVYFYIDDISLIRCDQVNNKTIPESSNRPKIGKVIILKNIFFETDKSDLLNNSFQELDTLVNFLLANPNTTISISGYTDNIGSEEHNKQLSLLRAKAVASYLILKGINKSRVSYDGYGSSKPIKSNNTENGRKQNRRVEFLIK